MKCFRHRPAGFTLIELLVVITVITILMSLLMPALLTARSMARRTACLNNLKQLSVSMQAYRTDYDGYWPTARDKTRGSGLNIRWPLILARNGYLGAPATDDDRIESAVYTENKLTNEVLICPAIEASTHRAKEFKRGEYARSGSYGMNWQVVGPFPGLTLEHAVDDEHARLFPVNETSIRSPQSTVVIGDAYGEFDKSSGSSGPHAYTLDPPKLMQSRWGTGAGDPALGEVGIQTPADPRHHGDMTNYLFADGHADSMTMREAGYSADTPGELLKAKDDVGDGNNRFWNGTGTP